jgi:hypothetical protein
MAPGRSTSSISILSGYSDTSAVSNVSRSKKERNKEEVKIEKPWEPTGKVLEFIKAQEARIADLKAQMAEIIKDEDKRKTMF